MNQATTALPPWHTMTTVRTTIVRGGQFRLSGTLVKPTQQVLVDVPLAVPPATLDNELQPNNDADGASICLLGVEIVEPVDA